MQINTFLRWLSRVIRPRLAAFLKSWARRAPDLFPPPRLADTEQTSIRLFGNFDASPLSTITKRALFSALALDHRLPGWVMDLEGMSGKKYRIFVNTVMSQLPGESYLEVGSWAGSTAVSAMVNNECSVVCIDNWSEFDGPKKQFERNMKRAANRGNRWELMESDFRQVNFDLIAPRPSVYLFDGPHTDADQFDGIVAAIPALREEFLLIVDDYNFSQVRAGTVRAISQLGLEQLCAVEILTTQNGVHPRLARQASDWHNGYLFAVLRQALP